MSALGVVTLCVIVVMASAADRPRRYDLAEAPQLFEKFMQEHKRVYLNPEDQEKHYAAFTESLKKINKLNEANPSAVFGINKFADYTKEERENMFGYQPKLKPETKEKN